MTHDLRGPLSRRDTLKLSAALGAAALGSSIVVPGCATSTAALGDSSGVARANRRRVLRLAHLTDWHIQPERGAFDGVAACLHHAQSQKDAPQIIVTGGDLIMDGYDSDRARTQTQWDVWNRVCRGECSTPMLHTLGNHDIWGWNKPKSKTTGNEEGWGKKWACQMVGRELPYHAVDVEGAGGGTVRLVILDSVRPHPDSTYGYIAYLDEVQHAWLEALLADTPRTTHVVVVSHIPIVSATWLVNEKQGMAKEDFRVARGVLHADATRLMSLFSRHPNVRACLSGHMHLLDRVDMNGVTYLCDGAVCGAWWKGANQGVSEGYALVDIYSDGSVEREYVPYGWAARET